MFFPLHLSQTNEIKFVMVNNAYTEVAGLGNTFTLEINKSGSAVFVPSTGVKSEVSSGAYRYVLTAAECNTRGAMIVKVTAPGCIQQNLLYWVDTFIAGCNVFTYTLTDSVTLLPIPGADVWITTDLAGNNIIFRGMTDVFGVLRDTNNNLPCLDTGAYYVWSQKPGWTPNAWPDLENVP